MKTEPLLLIGCCGNIASYAEISKMGYDYAELSARQLMTLSDEEFHSFLKLYNHIGFPCRGFNDFCGPEYPLVGPNSNLESLIRYTEQVCIRGHALGIRTIGIGAPQARCLPENYPQEQANMDMASFFQAASPIASKYGITLLAEAVHKYLCNYMTYTDDAFKMVKYLDLPNVFMVLDYYHAQVMGENLLDFSKVLPSVRHLHISTDLRNHIRGFPHPEDLPLIESLLDEAIRCGYRGGVSVEASADFLQEDGAPCAKLMHQAVSQVCKNFKAGDVLLI